MISLLLKHKLYEKCINTFFDSIIKNFNVAGTRGPQIGERFTRIYDMTMGDSFYNCILIPAEELSFYSDLNDSYMKYGIDMADISFGIRYQRYEDDYGDGESYESDGELYGETSFLYEELDEILFEK